MPDVTQTVKGLQDQISQAIQPVFQKIVGEMLDVMMQQVDEAMKPVREGVQQQVNQMLEPIRQQLHQQVDEALQPVQQQLQQEMDQALGPVEEQLRQQIRRVMTLPMSAPAP